MQRDPKALDDFLSKQKREAHKIRVRSVIYTLIPALMACALIIYSSKRIQNESRIVQKLKQEKLMLFDEIKENQEHIDLLIVQLEESERRLQMASNLEMYSHDIDMIDLKHLASLYPRQERILLSILEYKSMNVGWRLNGKSPNEGFDSPGFAMFIIKQAGLPSASLLENTEFINASRSLYDNLPNLSEPEIGDLVFYPAGYVLFYFEDRHQEPFVIGMTPFGIISLNFGFDEPIGFRDPD